MLHANRRGQLLTTDFILSLAIFLAILLATMSLWASVDTQIKDAESRRDMQAITTTISESLVRSQGYPKNWTNETVKMIGLAKEEHVLDINKILSLKHMDYDNVSSILRLANYNYHISITDGAGYDLTSGIVRSPVAVIVHKKSGMEYAKMLNGSVVTWDIYYSTAGSDPIPDTYANSFTARFKYGASGAEPASTSLIKFMANQSGYRTLIIEDIGLNSTLNRNDVLYAPELKDLVNFTKRGGILIYTDTDTTPANKPLIADNFSMEIGGAPGGTDFPVNFTAPVLINASPGEKIRFSPLTRSIYKDVLKGDPPLNFIVNGSATACLICWWDYGFGRVYYIGDNQGTYNITGSTSPLTSHLNIVGENMTMGKRPSNQTTDLISVKRTVLISGFEREVANLNLVVWR